MDLNNKTVVITGGSQGFGKGLAKIFIAEGSKVIISSNDKDALEATVKELLVDQFFADVTALEDIKKLGEYVFEKYGAIDIWINNAGIQIEPSLVEDTDIEKLHNLFDINFFGYFYGCQIALSYMKKRGEGLILNINSTAGLGGKPEISAYASSKFAVRGLTESIREEVKNSGIKIFEVFPGGMQTGLYKGDIPANFNEYMKTDSVAKKVIENLKLQDPKIDLIIKRPVK